jgi:hypothetical protein
MDESKIDKEHASSNGGGLVFISHDTRDGVIAEAFSKLLSGVSAGVLKSFRSSDRKGNQGIEYGVEWFPEIMKKLEDASDVVCLITPQSGGRPWILYEAGVAKGKLSTPVYGVALGIPLSDATSGPFAQFQNCDDDIDSLTTLVMQLVSKIPGAEPDRDVVQMQVSAFLQKIQSLLVGPHIKNNKKHQDGDVAKTFEEVKVMFNDLSIRLNSIARSENRTFPRRSRQNRASEFIQKELFDEMPDISLKIILSMVSDSVPWILFVVDEFLSSSGSKSFELGEKLKTFIDILENHPIGDDLFMLSVNNYTRSQLGRARYFVERIIEQKSQIKKYLPVGFEKLNPRKRVEPQNSEGEPEG